MTLATQTAQATETVSRQIQEMRAASEGAVRAIQSIAKVVHDIDAIAAEVLGRAVPGRAGAHRPIAGRADHRRHQWHRG